MKKRKLLSVICLLTMSILNMQVVAASTFTSGFSGVSTYDYPHVGDCIYGNRAGGQYVTNLSSALSSQAFTKVLRTNSEATKNDLTLDTVVNSVNFFAYSGHGLSDTSKSSAHYYATTTGDTKHTNLMESSTTVNAVTTEVRLGHGNLKWFTSYSCNWLNNAGSSTKQTEIYKTFEGASLTMGYASVMYLDSREGTEYGKNIINAMSIRRSFIEASKKYQVQRTDGDTIARVVGYTVAKDDTYFGTTVSPTSSNWYINNPTKYSVIESISIPRTGQPI